MTESTSKTNIADTIKAARLSFAAFTIVELLVAMSVMAVVSTIAFSFIRSGTLLTAKSTRLNHSHDELRIAFDRLADHLLSANNVPTLIGTNGLQADVSTVTDANGYQVIGPAAGLKFDKVVGDPYVLDPPAAAGSFNSNATSLNVWRSTNSVATAPIPTVGDVIIIETPTGTARAQISAVTVHSASGATQKISLTFSSALGKSLSWLADQPQIAKVVRPEAFIVMPANGRNELRFYPQFEPLPTLSDRSKYKVLTMQVGTASGESTPFSLVDMNGDRIVQSTLRVRETDYAGYLSRQEQNSYSGYFQLLLNLPSRLRPKTTN
jgi:type II secretory pathway pseudopilin PulG